MPKEFGVEFQIPDGIDYIFYCPVEQKYFPGFSLNNPIAYQDNNVIIFKAGKAGIK